MRSGWAWFFLPPLDEDKRWNPNSSHSTSIFDEIIHLNNQIRLGEGELPKEPIYASSNLLYGGPTPREKALKKEYISTFTRAMTISQRNVKFLSGRDEALLIGIIPWRLL